MSRPAPARVQAAAKAPAKPSPRRVPKPDLAIEQGVQDALGYAEEPTTGENLLRFRPQSDFASVNTVPEAHGIWDDAAGRALVTQLLIQQLAPLLGLDPSRIRIQVDAAAASRVDAHGASGLVEDGKVFLHPRRYAPESATGRYLLAHETVHLAQAELMPKGQPDDATAAAAEVEADEIGQAFAHHRRVVRPRLALVKNRPAADKGERLPTLIESVVRSRSREISAILGYLSGWWISDDDVFKIMRLLDTMPLGVAKAVVQSLGSKKRYELADNINPPHVYKHRSSVLACYSALGARQFDAVDLKVFRALPATGLTTEETEAAFYSIKHLTDGQRQKLFRSENGPAIRRISQASQPSASERTRLLAATAKAAQEEADLAVQRDAILKHQADKTVPTLIDQVRSVLYPASDEGFSPARDARRALDLLARARSPRTRFLYIAEQLQEQGLIDSLLETLPPSAFSDTEEHTETLITLVQSRLPSKNSELIENLLSTGLFDWAIRDYEALFAYRLIKLLPLSEQYRFRQRDAGKWYIRLLENLPDDPGTGRPLEGLEIRKAKNSEEVDRLKASGIRVDEKEMLFDASQLYARKLTEQGATTALHKLRSAFQEADDTGFTDARAQKLFRRLAALGNASLQPGKAKPADTVLRAAVIHELDGQGYIDKLFSALSEGFLFAEENRIATVRIMLSRDPARVQSHARGLVSRGFLDWMVTDQEAYLAYQCVKALPEEERLAFIDVNADKWSEIQSEMSAARRQSRDLNLYIGDEAGTDRASVLGKLAVADTWTGEKASLLDGLLRMSIAMTEHRFAFERSKEFAAHENAALLPLVEKYRLFNPGAGRTEYEPELLKGTKWYEEGIFSTLRTLWSGLVLLWNLDILFVDRSIGVNKLDLNQLQDVLGGDAKGARLADPAKGGDKQVAPHPDANKLTVLVGLDGKSAEVILPELLIESANIQLASSTLQSGSVTLKNLHIHAAYDSEDLGQPTQVHVSLDSVEANDLLLAKSHSMISVTRLIIKALRLAAGTVDTVTGGVKGPRKGVSIPFPLLVVPLLALFILLSLPVYLYKRIEKFVTGLESETGKEFAGDVAERTKAIDFSFSSLDVDGITTSGGQHVGRVGVKDLAVRVGLNKATRLRAELASLNQRLSALQGKADASEMVTKLQARRKQVNAELATATAQETKYLEISKKIRGGGLTPAQQEALQAQLDELKFEQEGGAFLDIGSIEIEDISGTVTSKTPLKLENIHGEGTGAILNQFVGMETVTDAELSRRAGAGERPSSLLQEGKPGTFHLELGNVTTGQVSFGGGIRSLKDIDTKLKSLEPNRAKPEIAPHYQRLLKLRVKAERYELMVQRGLSALTPQQLEEFRQLRSALTAQADLILQSIELTQATLDVNLATGGIELGAAAAKITGVNLPERGLQIDTIEARMLTMDAAGKGGILAWLKWRENLQSAGLSAEFFQVSGVRHQFAGLLVDKATLTGGGISMSERGNVVKVGAGSLRVEGLGLIPRLGLMRQRLSGLERKESPSKKERAEIARLRKAIPRLEELTALRAKAFAMRAAAKTPEEIEAAKQAVFETEGIITLNLAQYGAVRIEVDELGVKATGAGDVLSDLLDGGFDLERMLQAGVTIQGSGDNDMLFRRFAVIGGQTSKDDEKSDMAANLGNFEMGETRANVKVQKDGTALVATINKLEIASASLSQMQFTSLTKGAGGMQLWSDGTSTMTGLTFDGHLRMEPKKGTEGKALSDFRLAHASIDNFRIETITADGLGYADLGEKIEVSIRSGSVSGVWATGLKFDIPEDKNQSTTILGAAGVESIRDVEIGRALMSGFEVNRGRINGANINVNFLKEAETEIRVGDLSLTAFALRGPDGWARFSLGHLRGQVNIKDGVYTLNNVRLGSLTVHGIHWKVGKKGFVETDQDAKLVGLRLTGQVATKKVPSEIAAKSAGSKPEQKTQVTGVKVTDFHIDSIVAQHLVYQDDEIKVEIKPHDATTPDSMKGFRPLYLENFNIKGLEWIKSKGLSAGEVDLAKFEASATFEDFKKGLQGGFALKGAGMTTTVIGPGTSKIDFGKIQKTGGFFKGEGIDTSFGTGQIVGSVTVGPGFVELGGLKVDDTFLGITTYRSDDGKMLTLRSANVKQITLESLRANMHTVKDEDGEDKQEVKEIFLRNLEFTGIRAGIFDYEGTSKIKNAAGVEGTSKQKIHGNGAKIDRLLISKIHRDQKAKLTTLSFDLSNRDKTKPAFKVSGLTGKLVKTFGTKQSVVQFATDVSGGAITGTDITFQTIALGKAKQPDGTFAPVTRTAIDGEFQFDRIGLINPDLTLTDEDGNVTRVDTYRRKGRMGRVEITGIRPRLLPNGTMLVPIDSIRANQLRVRRGNMTVKIPVAELENFSVALKGLGTEEGMQLLAAKADKLSVRGLKIKISVDRGAPATAATPSATTPPKFLADAIGGMSGELFAEPHLEYKPDPDVYFPVRGGKLNFEHVHPYAVNLEQGDKADEVKITIGNFGPTIDAVEELPKLKGMHPEQGEYGVIDFKELLEGIMNEPPASSGPTKPPADLSGLNDVTFGGHLKLGNGKMGFDTNRSGKLDAGDTFIDITRVKKGQNIIQIPKQRLGKRVTVLLPEFHASGASFAEGEGTTGDITVNNLRVHVSGLANLKFTIKVYVRKGEIKDIRFGDVTMLSAANLATVADPTLKEVNPKGEPGTP